MRRSPVVAALCVLFLVCAGAAEKNASTFYVQKATWQETLRASREALTRREAEERAAARGTGLLPDGFEPFGAQLTHGGAPVRVRVKVAGLKTLCLRVRNLKASRRGRGTVCFGNPRLIAADGKATPLATRGRLFVGVYGNRQVRDERDRRWGAVRAAAKRPRPQPTLTPDAGDELDEGGDDAKGGFDRGFMVQKDSELVFRLDGKFERFEAWACLHPAESAAGDTAQVMVDFRSYIGAKVKAATDRKAIWELIRRGFAGPHAIREQELEQRHRIWDRDWAPGDLTDLASRYARACSSPVRQRAQELAKAARTPADLAVVRGLFYLRDTRDHLAFARKTLELVERAAPRPKLAAEIAAIETLLDQAAEQPSGDWSGLHLRTLGLRRRIIFSHPALDFDRLLINKRPLSRYNHMCDQYLGRHSGVGAGLVVLDNWKESPKETVLLEGKLPAGCVRRPDLSFDGTRILFSFCDHTEKRAERRRFWIYEIGVDGTGLRQLTGTPGDPREGWGGRETVLIEDWDPSYLPDGGFAFITTRSQSFGRCHGSRYVPTYMLYRANADGSGIRQLSFGEANEWDPSVLHDGRIIYTRWDYINRHDTIFQSLWVMRPDGTGTAHFYGNYSRSPCMIAEAQAIPGSHKIVATGTDHHGRTSGTIIVIDPRKGQEEGEPLTCITPELGFPESGIPRGTTMTARPRHLRGRRAATPFPLSEDLFLVAYQQDRRYAIYLIDTLGGRELIYQDPNVSCFAPIPVRPRQRPPVLESLVAGKRDSKTGVFYIQTIHKSAQPIEPGSITRLRINRIYGQPTRSKPSLSLANNEIIKGIVGTVPVSPDGSVAFRAPAGVPLQFQALDENGMAVMTMRSLVYLQPGETVTCVGCHENRMDAPPHNFVPPTVKVRDIEPPAGPRYEGGFSFVRTVQPVLDRHCIRCHGLGKTDGKLNLLGTKTRYNQAHDALTARKGLVAIAYRNRESAFSKPKDYFSHAGRLAAYLLGDHSKHVKLDRDSFQRIVDWLDLNAQFYGNYSHNRIENARPTGGGEKALRKHIAQTFGEALAKQPFEALVNLALPAESRILKAPLAAGAGGWGQIDKGGWKSKNESGYKKMLELVQACVPALRRHDIAGTCGGDKRCSCGNCWVRMLRKQRKEGQPAKTAMRPGRPRS